MYLLLLAGLLAGGAFVAVLGLRQRRRGVLWTGILVCVAVAGFFALLDFWGEMFWFEAVGHTRRFWTAVLARLVVGAAAASVAAFLLALLLRPLGVRPSLLRRWPAVVAVALGIVWGLSFWERGLLFLYQVPSGLVEPVLGRDTSFYLFTLPLLDAVYWLMTGVALLAILVAGLNLLVAQSLFERFGQRGGPAQPARRRPARGARRAGRNGLLPPRPGLGKDPQRLAPALLAVGCRGGGRLDGYPRSTARLRLGRSRDRLVRPAAPSRRRA